MVCDYRIVQDTIADMDLDAAALAEVESVHWSWSAVTSTQVRWLETLALVAESSLQRIHGFLR